MFSFINNYKRSYIKKINHIQYSNNKSEDDEDNSCEDESNKYYENDADEDNINENDKHKFQIQIYHKIISYGEKMHYIYTMNQIDEDDLNFLSMTIENDIMEGFNNDPKSALKAFKVILMYNIEIPYNDDICFSIIDLVTKDDTFDDSEFLIFNYILKYPYLITQNAKQLIENIINDEDLGSSEKMMKFTSKLIRYFNFQISMNFYETVLQKVEYFNFGEKKSFLKLTYAIFLTNTQILHVIMDCLDTLKEFLFEMININPIESLFIISSIDEIMQSDQFIDDINLILMELQENFEK